MGPPPVDYKTHRASGAMAIIAHWHPDQRGRTPSFSRDGAVAAVVYYQHEPEPPSAGRVQALLKS